MIYYWNLKLKNQLIIKRKLNKNVIIHFYQDNHLRIIISINKKPIKNNLAEDETVTDKSPAQNPPNQSRFREPGPDISIYKLCSFNIIRYLLEHFILFLSSYYFICCIQFF